MNLPSILFVISIILCLTIIMVYYKSRASIAAWFSNFVPENFIGNTLESGIFQKIVKLKTDDLPCIQSGFVIYEGYNVFDLEILRDYDAVVTISLYLQQKSPNFYINKRSISQFHPRKALSKKYLLNKTNLNVAGTVSDEILDFSLNYDVDYFYSSYLPCNYTSPSLNTNFVELKLKVKKCDKMFIDCLFQIFSSCISENDMKVQKRIKEFEIQKFKANKNVNTGFFSQLKNEINRRKM